MGRSSCRKRACLLQHEDVALVKRQSFSFGSGNLTNSTTIDHQSTKQDLQILRWTGPNAGAASASIAAVTSALAQAVSAKSSSGTSIVFAMSGKAVAGAYAGSQIDNTGFGSIIQQLAGRESNHQRPHMSTAAQLCGPESLGSRILGVFIDRTGDLDAVKAALGSWNNATCLDQGQGEIEAWPSVAVKMVPGENIIVGPDEGDTSTVTSSGFNDNTNNNENSIGSHDLEKRATCKYTQAVSGDGCYSVAARCPVTQGSKLN